MVCSETKCIDYKKWYFDTNGGFPEIGFVAPDGKVGPLVYTPGIPKDAKCACVGVVVDYAGVDSKKRYWFKRLNVFSIVNAGEKKEMRLIGADTDRPCPIRKRNKFPDVFSVRIDLKTNQRDWSLLPESEWKFSSTGFKIA